MSWTEACSSVPPRLVFCVIVSLLLLLVGSCSGDDEGYEEFLWIRRLPSGQIHTSMEFIIERSSSSNINHTSMFPRALSEILTAHSVHELHISLTQGHWRLESWGDPHPTQTAPTGAHVVAWFSNNSSDSKVADANWRGLTNRLSGLTCASLNFLDETTSISPKFAYQPVGRFINSGQLNKPVHVRVGSLPREFICTENLTPWTKLLPCGIMRGIASLLRSKQVFNTHYHSASIQYIQNELNNQLKLSLSLVFDNPSFSGQSDNFVKNVIGSTAIFPCHSAKKTTVKLWANNDWKLVNQENLNSLKLKDISDDTSLDNKNLVFTPMKYMGGYGQEYGKMVVEMTNHLSDQFLSVLYVEVLPWYIRPYLHTISIEVARGQQKNLPVPPGDYFHYTPGIDRKALHKLEMDVQIPPASKVTLSFLVEKGHLKWDEYPPDANHGFYLEAAHFEVNSTTNHTAETRHYYSRILLINLSTPDFSMPYNVICLTCTVVALAFGPIHNITTKRLQLKEITGKAEKLKQILKKIWKKKPMPAAEVDVDGLDKESSESEEGNSANDSR